MPFVAQVDIVVWEAGRAPWGLVVVGRPRVGAYRVWVVVGRAP